MTGGTGLGLSMVRHIAANHGGRVSVESTEGEGATFTMELPLIPDNGEDDPDALKDHLSATTPAAPPNSTTPGASNPSGEGTAAPAAPGESTVPGASTAPGESTTA